MINAIILITIGVLIGIFQIPNYILLLCMHKGYITYWWLPLSLVALGILSFFVPWYTPWLLVALIIVILI